MQITVFYTIFLNILTLSLDLCGQSLYMTEFADIYGLEVSIIKEELQFKCDCCSSNNSKSKQCYLYRMDIDKILYQQDTTVYKSNRQLEKVKYFVSQEKISDINGVHTILCENSCSKDYLLLNKHITGIDIALTISKSDLIALVGLGKCKKFNFWQKLLLNLNISRKKIYQNAKPLTYEDSEILEFFQEK